MKSKIQKQAEALLRKQAAYPSKLTAWCNTQYGSEGYKDIETKFGRDEADKRAVTATKQLRKFAQEAGTDIHGNCYSDPLATWQQPKFRNSELPQRVQP